MNEFPYTNFHELNLDWILHRLEQAIKSNLRPSVVSVDGISANIDGDVPLHAVTYLDLDPENTNCSTDLQAAINGLSNGGTIIIPPGRYTFQDTINLKTGVSIRGSGLYSTTLIFNNTNSKFFNGEHVNVQGVRISDIAIKSNTEHSNIGLSIGCDVAEYFTGNFRLENVLFIDFSIGVYGGAVTNAIGLFDSLFINVWFQNCTTGFWCYGSGNTYVHCRFQNCANGFVLDRLSTTSMDGGCLIGSVFVNNNTDIFINASIRPFAIYGCWFETSHNGIITIQQAANQCPMFTIDNCTLNTNSTTAECVNFYNAGTGLWKISNCHFIQTDANAKNGYTVPYHGGTFRLHDCVATDNNGVFQVLANVD